MCGTAIPKRPSEPYLLTLNFFALLIQKAVVFEIALYAGTAHNGEHNQHTHVTCIRGMSHKAWGEERTATSLDTRNGINLGVGGSLCFVALILVIVVVIVVIVLAHLCGGGG
jgi:hypothetical protein